MKYWQHLGWKMTTCYKPTGNLGYDVYEDTKKYNSDIVTLFDGNPKFSICHGINIANGGVINEKVKSIGTSSKSKEILAYLYSTKEVELYKKKFLLDDKCLKVVGVPRHQTEWMNLIIEHAQSGEKETWNDYIFIISRPDGTNYHPKDRKIKAIEDIKKLAFDKLDKKIIVKLHPKERNKGMYEQILGKENLGKKWKYSTQHPFILGKNSLFAIAFYSGVPADMIALGVPIIEYLNLKGIPECDNELALRDCNGEPVFSYRYLGLVLGASNYRDLEQHATEILENREKVINNLQAKYQENFKIIENPVRIISDDIISKLLKMKRKEKLTGNL